MSPVTPRSSTLPHQILIGPLGWLAEAMVLKANCRASSRPCDIVESVPPQASKFDMWVQILKLLHLSNLLFCLGE